MAETDRRCAASSLATLFVVRNFFPAEEKVRHSIRTDYAVGDDTFVRTMGHLLGPPLVEGNKITRAGKRRSHLPGDAEGDPFGATHNYV